MTPDESITRTRSHRLLAKRAACFDHARELIDAAESLLSAGREVPNIAFHLALLAIEEMGKAGLLTSREISARDSGIGGTGWIDKRFDDHAFKLLWGLWSPTFHGSKDGLSPAISSRFE